MVGAEGHLKGIIPNTFAHVFDSISANAKNKRFLLRCSYLEIYNECINDLLDYSAERKLELKEDPQKGIYVKGLSSAIVRSVENIEQTMASGANNRHTAETKMNKDSSRSHCIFTIYIETSEKKDGNELLKAGKLNLVDLAGSERQAKTQAEGMRLKEAAKINLSLSALGNVISALVDGKSSHIPYRDSKLTRLLQDSLGGNTKTLMIACVSPANYNYDETLSTLRYASRAKNIQNKPRINEDPKDALLRKYEEEIKSLKQMLEKLRKGEVQESEIEQLEMARQSIDSDSYIIEQFKGPSNNSKPKKQKGKEKDRVEEELEERRKECMAEKSQREQLEEMLRLCEQKLLCGGDQFKEKQQEQNKKYNELKKRLSKQEKREIQLIEEHYQMEEEIEMVEAECKTAQERIKAKDKIIENIEYKSLEAEYEIKDIQREHQEEKELLLDTIRYQNQEIDFYRKLVGMVIPDAELAKVRDRTRWDEASDAWTVPLFTARGGHVKFPAASKAHGLVEDDKKSRVLVFDGEEEVKKESQVNELGESWQRVSYENERNTPYISQTQRWDYGEPGALKQIVNWDRQGKSKEPSSQKKTARLQPLHHNAQGNYPMNMNGLTQREIAYPSKNQRALPKIEESLLTSIPKLYQNNEYLINLLERDAKAQYAKRPEKLLYGRVTKN